MKLRNKKTGEITKITTIQAFNGFTIYDKKNADVYHYDSLADLNVEWEDYEKTEAYYLIDLYGEVSAECPKYRHKGLEELGLVFETKEEAERAVEKLKAWKRLKDKGFRFCGYSKGLIDFSLPEYTKRFGEFSDDLDLLFGGEDE